MADDRAFPASDSAAYPGGKMAFVRDGLVNGAKAAFANAKWVAGGANGPQPPQYTGGPEYPSKGND